MPKTDHQAIEESSRVSRAFALVPRLLRNIFVGYIIFVLFLVTIGVFFIDFRTAWTLTPYGILFLLGAVLLGTAGCFIVFQLQRRVKSLSPRTFTVVVFVGCAALLIYQSVLIGSIMIQGADWDSPFMLDIQNTEFRARYYSNSPNNLFLGGVFVLVDAVCRPSGIDPHTVDCLISAVLITIAVGMTAFIGRGIAGSYAGIIVFAVAIVLCGISPWILIPYSDSFGLFCPTAVLFAFVCLKRMPVKWTAIIFFSYVGYCIKPTSLAVLGAIVLVCGCQWIAKRLGKDETARDTVINVRSLGITVLSCALALVVALGLTAVVKDANGVEVDSSKRISSTHYLMLGLNTESQGMYSSEDHAATLAEETVQGKSQKNLGVIQDRLQEMGLLGFAKLMCQKSLINYSSGDFGWSPDGTLLILRYDVQGDNQFFKEFYDLDIVPTRIVDGELQTITFEKQVERDRPCAYDVICQLLWMFVLVGIAFTLSARRPKAHEMVLAVSLLLLSGFLLLLECSPRYLFLYSPYFVLLGILGWQRAYSKITTSWQSRSACV